MKLGFLKCICKGVIDESTLRTLYEYFSLVRSRIDFAALIWHTYNITQNQSVSSLQNTFLRYLSYKWYLERIPHLRYTIPCIFFYDNVLDKRINLFLNYYIITSTVLNFLSVWILK
jgi:hypothetical protein